MLKLCDFGVARKISDIVEESGNKKNTQGTPSYMAPELFSDDGVYSFASDFWSLGIVLYELATGKTPFTST